MKHYTSRRAIVIVPIIVVITGTALCCLCSIVAQSLFFAQAHSTASPHTPETNAAKNAYIALARKAAGTAHIPPNLFVRQIDLESNFDPNALSIAGAEGIAQFMPGTATSLGIDPWNPDSALNGAATLMARYTQQFDGDYAKALAAYNAGVGTVRRALKTCGPTHWQQCLPAETQQYIHVIMQ